MNTEKICNYLKKLNIAVSEKQAEQFLRYQDILLEWNSFMNLTAITEPEEILIKHFADSLAIARLSLVQTDSDIRVLDIGTGAGFPAIPLKIAFPELKITMIDSLNKRIRFLDEVITQLQLENIRALHGRAEDYAASAEHRERYDLVVSRAVANMSTLSEYCLPYVRTGGSFVAYKSGGYSASDEHSASLHAISLLGGKLLTADEYTLPDTDLGRCLVHIEKIKPTAKKYPRKAGLPSRDPLT